MFLQLLIVATFLPPETDTFSPVLETMKALVSGLDLAGMYFLLTRGKSSGESTAIAVGLGTLFHTMPSCSLSKQDGWLLTLSCLVFLCSGLVLAVWSSSGRLCRRPLRPTSALYVVLLSLALLSSDASCR